MRIFFWGAGLVFAADRLTKFLALRFLDSPDTLAVWPGVFHLTLVHNTGVAFGMFKNAGPFFAAASLLSAAAIFAYFAVSRPVPGDSVRRWAWAAIAGGALGNAYDRFRFGAVVDFLDFRVWPVFNVADSAIVCAACAIAFAAFFREDVSK